MKETKLFYLGDRRETYKVIRDILKILECKNCKETDHVVESFWIIA